MLQIVASLTDDFRGIIYIRDKTFYGHKLRLFILTQGIFLWQAFPA